MNFKSIASAELEPRRLTIIAGSNSSGKSSLLQALLFLAQSFGEPTTVINGDLVRLGEPTDVIRDGAKDVTLEFRFPEIHRDDAGQVVEEHDRTLQLTLAEPKGAKALAATELSFWRDGKRLFNALREQPPPDLQRADEETTLRVAQPESLGLPEDTFVTLAGVTPARLVYRADRELLTDAFERLLADASQGGYFVVEELLRAARVAGLDDVALHRLYSTLEPGRRRRTGEFRFNEEDRQLLFHAFQELEAPNGWVTEPIGGAPTRRLFRSSVGEGVWETKAPLVARDLTRATDQVERLANAVLYLGPLRDDPRVAYPLGHTVRALPVGEKGEFTAAYLQENARVILRYRHPDGDMRSEALPNAVSGWCKHLGIAEHITVVPQGKLGHQLGLRVAGHERDPTAIGVGASQLLPVVVLVLGAPEGALVLLEQPELHLHPRVQSRLADFFMQARQDIRLIVETHSEYLLTRLRLRIAQGRFEQDDIAVLFASQRAESDTDDAVHTAFRKLSVDDTGDFDYWPEEFFDSLDVDTTELAEAVAERVRRRSDPSVS